MELSTFLSGALLTVYGFIGLHFLRFWKLTRDVFFIFFALAFFLLAIERIPIFFLRPDLSGMAWVYGIRLSAFILIILAIVIKNRKTLAQTKLEEPK